MLRIFFSDSVQRVLVMNRRSMKVISTAIAPQCANENITNRLSNRFTARFTTISIRVSRWIFLLFSDLNTGAYRLSGITDRLLLTNVLNTFLN